jgi:hypothetical protein
LNEEQRFDELARTLASGQLSRSQAIRWVGAALVGGALASIPGIAWAKPKPGKCNNDKQCPSPYKCVNGQCACSPTNCTGGQVLNPNNCQCECPPGTAPACTAPGQPPGGCVSTTVCGPNGIFICGQTNEVCCPSVHPELGGCVEELVCKPAGTVCPG